MATGQAIRERGKNAKGQGRNALPCSVREMSTIEAAWMGAMIDGEGCILRQQQRGFDYTRLSMGNTEPELVSAFLRATGVGCIIMGQQKKAHHRPFFNWTVNRQNDVFEIIRQCRPFSIKCQQALEENDGNWPGD